MRWFQPKFLLKSFTWLQWPPCSLRPTTSFWTSNCLLRCIMLQSHPSLRVLVLQCFLNAFPGYKSRRVTWAFGLSTFLFISTQLEIPKPYLVCSPRSSQMIGRGKQFMITNSYLYLGLDWLQFARENAWQAGLPYSCQIGNPPTPHPTEQCWN